MTGPKCPPERASNIALDADLTRLPRALIKALMRPFAHSPVRYVLVGLSNTAVGFAVIWVALRGFGFGNVAANAAGYSVALLWSFALNRKWTFYHRGAVGSALLRYLLVTLAAYGLNLIMVILLERRLSQGSLYVQVGGMLTYTVAAYVGARYFVFPMKRALSGSPKL
jgi:putative flippase GtrA